MGITVAKMMIVVWDNPLSLLLLLPPLVVMVEEAILILATVLLEASVVISAFCWETAALDPGLAVVLTWRVMLTEP